MKSQLMNFLTVIVSLLATTIISTGSAYVTNPNSKLSVYWGQGPNQKRLSQFCLDSTIDIIPIGFINVFPDQAGTYGYPGSNFGNACGGYWVDPANQTTEIFANCYQIVQDMKICQNAGKKILLSLGGDSPGNFIASKSSAQSFAQFLWGAFGPVQQNFTGPRPFGNNVIDGFDLDIESGPSFGYADLVNQFRSLFATDSSKSYYISAAPQCVVPDAHLADAITNSYIDYLFIQFYNTPQCSASSYFNGGGNISWNQWASWTAANSMNPKVQLFLGLPASPAAVPNQPSNYLTLSQAAQLIQGFSCDPTYGSRFGGVMLFDATYSDNNQINGQSYAANIKNIMRGVSCSGWPINSTSPVNSTSWSHPTNYTNFPAWPTPYSIDSNSISHSTPSIIISATSYTTSTTVSTATTSPLLMTTTTTISSTSMTTTTTSSPLSTTITTTTSSEIVSPTGPFFLTVDFGGSKLRRSLTYIGFSGDNGVVTDETNAAVFSIDSNNNLRVDSEYVGTSTSTGFWDFQKYSSPPNVSGPWSVNGNGSVTFAPAHDGFCETAQATIIIELTSPPPFDCQPLALGYQVTQLTSTTTPPVIVSSTTTDTGSIPIEWPTTTTSTSSSPISPVSGITTSGTSDPISGSSTVSWEDWSSTDSPDPTSTSEADPASADSVSWEDWSTTDSSDPTFTSEADPVNTDSVSWEDWSSTVSSESPILPESTPAPASPSSTDVSPADVSPADVSPANDSPDVYTTVLVTSYTYICPTGFATSDYSLTATVSDTVTVTSMIWPTQSNGLPEGFTTTVTVCDVCADSTTTITLTIPTATITEMVTQTVFPVSPDTVNPIEAYPQATGTGASGYGFPNATGSIYPYIEPYTGGAAEKDLPGTVFSVTVCIFVAVAGFFL